MRIDEIDIVDIASARAERNKKALGYNTAVAKQMPLRTIEPGPDGPQMRNSHDILRDLAMRAMGQDKIKARANDAHLINIILEMHDLTKRIFEIAFGPTQEQREEIEVIRKRLDQIVAEVEAADETGQRK